MLRIRPTLLLMVLAFVAVASVPALALAQSAGDQQYVDPLASSNSGSSHHSTKSTHTTTSTQSAPSSSSGTSTSSNTSSLSPTSTLSSSSSSSSSTTSTTTTASAGTLPRTGFDALPVALLGLLLIAGGVGIRRTLGAR